MRGRIVRVPFCVGLALIAGGPVLSEVSYASPAGCNSRTRYLGGIGSA